MRIPVAAMTVFLALVVMPAAADKPGWAGQGGRPSDAEIQQHREQMRQKNDDKPQAGKQNAQGQQRQDDADEDDGQKQKSKQKEKTKQKQQQDSTFGQRYGKGGDQDRDQDQDQDREQDNR